MLIAAALLTASLGTFQLQSGRAIQDCKITYRTYGKLNAAKSNVVLFPTWFNGTTADLERYVSASGLVDDAKYYVITVDALANGVSSSPSNSKLQHGKLFPQITIRDMVESEYKLLTGQLGIRHVYAVMGISMGGMQTFQWMSAYPGFMDRGVTIVGTPKMGEKDIVLWSTYLNALHLGRPATPTATPGDATNPAPAKSMLSTLLALAPSVMEQVLPQQARQQMGQIFNGGTEPGTTPVPNSGAGTPAPPASLPMNKDPENVLHQFEAMIVHDISRPFGSSLDRAAGAIKAKTLVINSVQDRCVSPDLPQEFANLIHAEKFMMTGACGHNAYKPDCEESKIVPVIQKFLAE